MIIANYQVHNTLRAYGQQMADRSRFSKAKVPKSVAFKDQVSISPESKKRLMAEKIANQLVNQFGNGYEPSDTSREILNRLNREYGQTLQFEAKEGQGLAFKVADETKPQGSRYLSLEETEAMQKKLLEIARSVVYNNLG